MDMGGGLGWGSSARFCSSPVEAGSRGESWRRPCNPLLFVHLFNKYVLSAYYIPRTL